MNAKILFAGASLLGLAGAALTAVGSDVASTYAVGGMILLVMCLATIFAKN